MTVHPDFIVWYPFIESGGHLCAFDVVARAELTLDGCDDRDIAAFLDVIGVRDQFRNWSSRSFRSAFYGNRSARDWRDRFAPVWRVKAAFSVPLDATAIRVDYCGSWYSAEGGGRLASQSNRHQPDNSAAPVIVIAMLQGRPARKLDQRLDEMRLVRRTEVLLIENKHCQLRLKLDGLRLPNDLQHIEEIAAIVEGEGGQTHWSTVDH
jgi:hypothetical protein